MFLPGEFHGRKSLAGYSPGGRKSRTWLNYYTTTTKEDDYGRCRKPGDSSNSLGQREAKPGPFTGSHSDGRYQRLFHFNPQIFETSPKYLELSFMTAYAFVVHFLNIFFMCHSAKCFICVILLTFPRISRAKYCYYPPFAQSLGRLPKVTQKEAEEQVWVIP